MTANRLITYTIGWAICLLSISTTVSSQVSQLEAQKDPLEEFLVQNGLTRMLIIHREVRAESALNNRDQKIEKLQLAYARELFQPIGDGVWAKRLLAKAKFFLAAHPNRKSERLRLAVSHREIELLQGEYLKGVEVAQKKVDRIIEEVNLIQRGVKQQIDDLDRLTELKQTEIGDRDLLNQLRQQFRHGEFLLGWSHFLRSAASGKHSKPILRDAEAYFRSYLDLDPHGNLTKFSADQFGHRSRFQKIATAGLGAVMHGLGADEQSNHCFQIAQENTARGFNTESEVETIKQWKFAGYLRDNRAQAAQMLQQNPVLLGNNMLVAAILKQSDSADELVEQTLAGLALTRNPDRLREAINAFPDALTRVSPNSQSAAISHWIRGYLSLDDFQEDEEASSLKQATDDLAAAVKKFDPQKQAEICGHCRFLLGNCFQLDRNYADAAGEFLRAAELLCSLENFRTSDPDMAAESAYRASQSLRSISGDQKTNTEDIARWLNANFPASPFTKLAIFDVDLNRRDSLSDEDAVTYLSSFRENESSVLVRSAASVELAQRYSRSEELSIAHFHNYVKKVYADDQVSNDAQIKTRYYYISKLLSQANPSHFEEEINDALIKVKELLGGAQLASAQSVKTKTTQAAKLLYFQSLILRTLQPKNHKLANEYFQHIKRLNHSSAWTAAATLEIAKIFENAEDKVRVDGQVFRGMMIDVYEFLSKLPKSKKVANQDIVSLKLAQLYVADDRLLEAEALVGDANQGALWLPTRANLAERKNDLRRSASLWQQVENQSSIGTAPWLDARLKRLLVLYQFDELIATQLLTQTIALHPNMPPTYATQFQELADQWGPR